MTGTFTDVLDLDFLLKKTKLKKKSQLRYFLNSLINTVSKYFSDSLPSKSPALKVY